MAINLRRLVAESTTAKRQKWSVVKKFAFYTSGDGRLSHICICRNPFLHASTRSAVALDL
jgi:hypothetical protein